MRSATVKWLGLGAILSFAVLVTGTCVHSGGISSLDATGSGGPHLAASGEPGLASRGPGDFGRTSRAFRLPVALHRRDAGTDRSTVSACSSRSLVMGCVTFAKESTRRSFRRLCEYLSSDLGIDLAFRPFERYSDIVNALVAGGVDVAMLSPIVFLKAHSLVRLVPVAYGIFRSSGYFSYKSVILVPLDSPVIDLAQLKGRRMAFVDPRSTSGYQIPSRALARHGLALGDLASVRFYGNHVDTVLAVCNGKADAAATFDDLLTRSDKLAPYRCRLRRLWTSRFVIPADCFAASTAVGPDLRHALRASLLSYFAAQRSGSAAFNELYEGFVPGDPSLYDDLKHFLGYGPGKVYPFSSGPEGGDD